MDKIGRKFDIPDIAFYKQNNIWYNFKGQFFELYDQAIEFKKNSRVIV